MNINRRLFFSLFLVRPRQSVSLRFGVLEIFTMNEKVSAVLVNHAAAAERDQFARWLQAHPRSAVKIRNKAGQETAATIFRVRMRVGRGLLLLNQPNGPGRRSSDDDHMNPEWPSLTNSMRSAGTGFEFPGSNPPPIPRRNRLKLKVYVSRRTP